MEQTPIEMVIEKLRILNNDQWSPKLTDTIKYIRKNVLPYEKTYHRNIAEKAWDAGQEWNDFIDDDGTLGEIIHNKMPFDREDFIKKQLKL